MKNIVISAKLLVLALVLGGAFAIAGTAQAATVTVGAPQNSITGDVCSFAKANCPFEEDGITVNIPHDGTYTITGRVRRGAHDGCQANEDFHIFIDGVLRITSRDTNPCEGVPHLFTNENYGTLALTAGTHTIKIQHARPGAQGSNPNSVRVDLTFTAPDPAPRITIDKNDNDNGDDTQTVISGNTATFRITVRNTGTASLNNVVVTDAQAPSCARTASQTTGLYSGNTFDPGESFSYTCTATNVTSGFTNSATVTGRSTFNNATTTDTDTSAVVVPGNAGITIDKDDNDNSDDTQAVNSGDTATFTITVTNNGSTPLNNVVVTDAQAPSCARTASQTAALYDGNTFDVGESFSYTCTVTNVTSGFTNSATVTGTSTETGETTTDTDTSDVTVNGTGGISIDKNDADNGDDRQDIDEGDTATFRITVTNNGSASLTNVVVTDAQAPGCARSAAETAALYPGDTFDSGESFSYTCSLSNVGNSFTNSATATGTPTNGTDPVSSTDTSRVIVEEEEEDDDDDDECESSIGNRIWHDRNGNGVQDPGEEGINGVTVKLIDGNDVEKETTNSSGKYEFDDLCEGTYTVVVDADDIPAGCYQTGDPDSKLDNTTEVDLDEDDEHTKADFGFRCPGTKVAPATGPGSIALMLSVGLAFTLMILYKTLLHDHVVRMIRRTTA